jgi:hypothetical protein
MYSDVWLKLSYRHGARNKVSNDVDYEIWTDDENNIIGVTVNFEGTNDYHYELYIEEWMKFLDKVLKTADLTNTQKLFERFLRENDKIFDFQYALQLHGIKYDKIAFY